MRSGAWHVAGLLACVLTGTTAGALERAMDAGQLAHEVDRLARTGRVLYVAAHPDDENTRLLTWLANEKHLRVAYLSMTRGGGGQNLIGREQGTLLDVIRTEELLAARRLDGAHQRFSRMRDFGYSKTPQETLSIWNHEEALADVVWVLRTFQPDVVITRFDELPPNHGHHTASAILAREAFTAAADPTRFPEQLEQGATTWQVDRLLHNVSPWRDGPVPADAIELDVGAYDPRLGMSYGELAALSRSQHRSQGFGVAGERGRLIERFVTIAGTRPEKDLLEGLALGWERVGPAGVAVAAALAEARATLDRDTPERAILALLKAQRAFDRLPDSVRVREAKRDLERVIAACAGLFVRATVPRPTIVPGASVKVDLELVQRRPAALKLERVTFPGVEPITPGTALGTNEKQVISREVSVPANAAVSIPYWLVEPLPGRFTVRDPKLVGAPKGPPALAVEVELSIGDRRVRVEAPVVHAWTDPVLGERVRDVTIAPPATVTPLREAVLFPNGAASQVLVRVRGHQDSLSGIVSLPVPAGWRVTPPSAPVAFSKSGEETTVSFVVQPPKNATAIDIAPTVRVGGREWAFREDVIDYPHIPVQLVLQPSSVRLVPLALKLPKGLVGYVPGSGDTVAEDLVHVGLRVERIDDRTLLAGDLKKYAAIVVGIRAYNARDVVRAAHPRLMRYVEDGGTVVVQYVTNSRVAPLLGPIGPYPIEIARDRITDETAAVEILQPKHPLVTRPNPIGPADFEGWVQERGIYFASKWDDRYVPLFRMADPGEEPLTGSTLVVTHGKGRYVYTGLAFFRQLPAGVPGAYRLFVNLLSR